MTTISFMPLHVRVILVILPCFLFVFLNFYIYFMIYVMGKIYLVNFIKSPETSPNKRHRPLIEAQVEEPV